MDAINTFDQPNAVQPAPFNGAKTRDGKITLSVPAKAVVVLSN